LVHTTTALRHPWTTFQVYNQQWLKENDTRQPPKVAIIA
jgi:hypothetical protein